MNKAPARILYLITDTETGGAEKVLLETIRHLDHSRFYPELLTLKSFGTMAVQFRNIPTLPLSSLEMGNYPNPMTFWRLVRHLRRGRYSILHTFLYQADILGRLAGRLAGVPIIVSSLRCSYRWLKPWHFLVDRWTSRLADHITSVSEATRAFAIQEEGIAADRIATLRNGIDLTRFQQLDRFAARQQVRTEFQLTDQTVVLSTVGRLHPQKGHDCLFTALEGLTDLPIPWHLLVVGDGPLRGELQQRVASGSLAGRVTFTGTRQDIPQLLAASDLFAFPSLYEGLPNAVIEAMASSLPVVAAAADGTPEVVVDGVTGRLVPPADAKALRAGLAELIASPTLRDAWGETGRRRAETDFSLARMMGELHTMYDSLLERKCAK